MFTVNGNGRGGSPPSVIRAITITVTATSLSSQRLDTAETNGKYRLAVDGGGGARVRA